MNPHSLSGDFMAAVDGLQQAVVAETRTKGNLVNTEQEARSYHRQLNSMSFSPKSPTIMLQASSAVASMERKGSLGS